MAVETVRIYSVDQDDNALAGVLVRVLDATGTTFITQGYTALVGSDAYVDFDLPGDVAPISYTIRLSKTGAAFDGSLGNTSKTVQVISVYSPPSLVTPNGFQVKGETFPLPSAVDPRLCRCTGYFKDASGKPLVGLFIFMINQFKPAIVDGYSVLGAKLNLQTDADGLITVDLYRCGIYRAQVESVQAAEADETGAIIFTRDVRVPDRPYANLVSLLFPVIDDVTWPTATLEVNAGETLDVVPTITCSDGRTLAGVGVDDVIYDVEDSTIASVSASDDKITVLGKLAGTTNLTVTRKDQTIVTVPSTNIDGSPIVVNVH